MSTAHSKIGASTCERWWNCPGSVRAVAALPPQKESPYAAEGTAAHELGEICLRDGRDAIDHVGEFAQNGYEFTGEMAEAVQVYLDVIRFDMETYDITKEELLIEHKFHLAHIDKDAFGTNDCNLPVFLDKVIVYDYKHGQGLAVDAEENKQLLYYALGAVELGDYDTVDVVIVQPRAGHKLGPIRRWSISVADLKAFADELKVKIEATRSDKAEFKCGVWCKKTFCPNMPTCPAVRGFVEKESQMVFTGGKIQLPKPETLNPLIFRRMLDSIEIFDAWSKSLWAHAEAMANRGEEVPGYKLVRGKEGNRKWTNEVEVMKMYREVCMEESVMSPAKLEKKLGKEHKDTINALTTRPEGKIILVPLEDPREEVQPNATQVFMDKDSIEHLL